MAVKNKRPAPKNVPQKVKTPAPTANWDEVLANLAQSSAGPFFFVKSPRTRMRLVCLADDEREFYAGATTYYKGKPKTKFVVFAKLIASEGGDKGNLSDDWKNKISPVVITKTVLTGIIALLAEGYDLFGEKTGYGITILKSGSGTDTDYNVNPSPQPIPLTLSSLEMPEMALLDYADELSNRSEERNNGGGGSKAPKEEGDW